MPYPQKTGETWRKATSTPTSNSCQIGNGTDSWSLRAMRRRGLMCLQFIRFPEQFNIHHLIINRCGPLHGVCLYALTAAGRNGGGWSSGFVLFKNLFLTPWPDAVIPSGL